MTSKQRGILIHLEQETRAGRQVSLDGLISHLGASATKQAMQSTLRTLEVKHLLERRYCLLEGTQGERFCLVLELTPSGRHLGAALKP